MKLLFIAGTDSSHSHRWIGSFLKPQYKLGWISLQGVEAPKNQHLYKICPKPPTFNNKFLQLVFMWLQSFPKVLLWRPDVIHIHYMGTNGLLGLLLPCRFKVFTAWGSDVIFPKYPWLVKLMIKRADLITTDADHVFKRLIELGAKKEQIRIINFGIETQKFIKQPFSNIFREKLFPGASEDDPIIVSLRNHEEVYDIPTLINAAPEVLKIFPNAKFAIGGSGTLTESYKELVKKLNLTDSFNFFGRYDHKELPHLFGQCTAYVSTSLSDAGISGSTAEAMSCEVPVIISMSGENELWVKDQVNGLLFQVKDHLKLSRNIIDLLNKESFCEEIGKRGREVILDRNDLVNEMSKMENLYKNILV